MENINLSQLKPGKRAIIKKILLRGKHRMKLMDMGLVEGATIELLGVAPLGDPMEIKIKGIYLSLRKEDAAMIQIELLDKEI